MPSSTLWKEMFCLLEYLCYRLLNLSSSILSLASISSLFLILWVCTYLMRFSKMNFDYDGLWVYGFSSSAGVLFALTVRHLAIDSLNCLDSSLVAFCKCRALSFFLDSNKANASFLASKILQPSGVYLTVGSSFWGCILILSISEVNLSNICTGLMMKVLRDPIHLPILSIKSSSFYANLINRRLF